MKGIFEVVSGPHTVTHAVLDPVRWTFEFVQICHGRTIAGIASNATPSVATCRTVTILETVAGGFLMELTVCGSCAGMAPY